MPGECRGPTQYIVALVMSSRGAIDSARRAVYIQPDSRNIHISKGIPQCTADPPSPC
jgi:hypothetical protein